jgi:hypothetical protein
MVLTYAGVGQGSAIQKTVKIINKIFEFRANAVNKNEPRPNIQKNKATLFMPNLRISQMLIPVVRSPMEVTAK